MISFSIITKTTPRIIVFFAITIIIAASIYSVVNRADAVVPVYCPIPCEVWNVDLSGELGDSCPGWFVTKEYAADLCRFKDVDYWNKSLLIIFEYQDALIEWIRTGQDDFFTAGTRGTLFVTNNDEFKLVGGADNAASVFLEEYFTDAYSKLCDPFREIVGEGISTSYGRDYGSFKFKAGCTAEEIVQDLESFYADFRNGGWAAWTATAWYENNPDGLGTLADAESFEREHRAARANELDFLAGNGFPGLRACDEDGVTPGGLCWKYKTNTPGKIIQVQFSDGIELDADKLRDADEVFETVVSGFTSLTHWIWSGGSGGEGYLYGIQPSGSGGGQPTNPPGGPGGGQPPGGPSPGPQQRAVCHGNQCVAAFCEPGKPCFNECNIQDPSSCTSQIKHAECQNNQCVMVRGRGDNECDITQAGCVPPPPPGTGAQRGYCANSDGTTSNCSTPVDCNLCAEGQVCIVRPGQNCRECSQCACNDGTVIPGPIIQVDCKASCDTNGGVLVCKSSTL